MSEPTLSECAQELADLVDEIVAGNYTPDSFTTQPIRRALAKPEIGSGQNLADANSKSPIQAREE